MNKKELIAVIAEEAALTKKDSEAFVNAFTAAVGARTGINPQTGKKIKIKASKAPHFRAGAELKREVNTKPAKKSKK